jgi:hypothetical protein
MATTSRAEFMKHWEELLATIAVNPELAYMEAQREQLESELEEVRDASRRQAASKAQAQQATRDIEEHLARGRDIAIRLHDGIRMQYGRVAEKLAEFRLQPRRPVVKKPPPSPPPPETTMEMPPEPGATPARTATPENDVSA